MEQRDFDETKTVLTKWLIDRLPNAADVEVADLQIPSAGASNETILFTGNWLEDGSEQSAKLVLRIQPDSNQLFLNYGVFLQWDVMEALASSSNVPVPSLRWRE